MMMNAEGIREIAKMQCSIDGYSYFLNNLYLKLIYPNKEIASILSITTNSVITARYRLKRKLGLTQDQQLDTWIQSIGKTEEPK